MGSRGSKDKLNAEVSALEKRLKEKKNLLKAAEQREMDKQLKVENRQKIISGGIFLDIFSDFKRLQPQKTNAQNDREFKPIADFLLNLRDELEANKELADRLHQPRSQSQAENSHQHLET